VKENQNKDKMAAISFLSDTVSKLFELFHLPKDTFEVHIHFKRHEAVTIEASYFMQSLNEEEMEKLRVCSKTFELKEIKEKKKGKEVFAKGLFIRKDVSGIDCCVGDYVRVTQPAFTIRKAEYIGEDYNEGGGCLFEKKEIEEKTYEGTLLLLKSRGVVIKLNTGEYITPKLTDKARNPWKWEKINTIV